MNIVQINHFNDYIGKRYTFRVPEGIELKKGDVVQVKTRNGKKQLATCVTDSHIIEDEELLLMVTGGNKVCSDVIGVYNLVTFEELKRIEEEIEKAEQLQPLFEKMKSARVVVVND